ncbi:hypothetical protein ACFLR9_08060 [Bacteroidota bacterium]
MKKIIPLLMTIALVFVSCETESLNEDGLTDIEARGKVKKEKSDSEICAVNLVPTLPDLVNACVTANPGSDSYFEVNIAAGDLAGTDIPAWCIDVDLLLDKDDCFDANVYSSYGDIPIGKFENPQNFDLVNWIFNQSLIGSESPSGGNYTFGHVQWAIWELIDDANCQICEYLTDPTGEWFDDPDNIIKGQEIVDMALANGEGYKPGAGEYLAVILVPTNNKQSIFIPYLLECEPEPSCETAFGKAQTTNDGISTCFIELGDPYKFNRWGWTVELPSEGTYTFDIYAGVGQCDLSKGTLVGTAEVNYSGGTVSVDYDINDGFGINEVHTYAGYDPVPSNPNNNKPTVAPGQYTIGTGLSGKINVILHSVICGDYED